MGGGDVTRIGRYDVVRQLGEGGMGRVLLARDTVLGREVAIKVLRDDLALTPELKTQLVERMRQEARAAAALSHPGMVTLHDMGEDEAVGLFLVFEYIDGPTLRDRLEERGPLAPDEVARLARTLGAALTHAHTAGVVHRDVKPENVMLSRVGPKLTDFGIARMPDSTLTRTSTVLGTPAYSAPEALASGAFGAASDQFSFAATLHEALTGRRTFPGDDALAVATRVATGKHDAATRLRPELRRFPHLDVIFDRGLAKEAKTRFATCQAFGEALAAELEGLNAAYLMTPVPRSSIVTRATRRWQNMAMLGALVVIAALVVAGRFQGTDADGVSLRAVASAFGATAAGGRTGAVTVTAPATASSHHGRGAPSGSASNGAASANGAAGGAAPAPAPATSGVAAAATGSVTPPPSSTVGAATTSGSENKALDSAPSDAGREHDAPVARAADAGAANPPQR
jgi:tRNA A-37 threonylcarbamoyl transferase component Bud32